MSKKIFSSRFFSFAFAIAATAIWFFLSSDAFAQSATFGEILCNAFDNAKPFGNVFAIIAYMAGVLAAVKGVYHLKLHVDSPQNNKIGVGLMYLAGAMGLLALPSAIGVIQHSIYGTSVTLSGSLQDQMSCGTPGNVTTTTGLDEAMTQFITNFKQPLMSVASVTAILAGLFMIVHGLIKASKYGTDPRAYSMHSILTNLGFGAVLMTIGNMMNVIVSSIFGHDKASSASGADSLNWTNFNALFGGNAADLERFQLAVKAALTFVQVIGVIAFVRGWLILKKAVEGSGNASLAQGLTHIIGGVLAINIFEFLTIMDHTFGLNLLGP